MNNEDQIQKFIDEGNEFFNKNLSSSNKDFNAWNSSLIRFMENIFGKDNTDTIRFKERSYSLSIFLGNTPDYEFVEAFERDLKITIAELSRLKVEIPHLNINNTSKEKADEKASISVKVYNENNNTNSNSVKNNMTIDEIRVNIEENTMIGEIDKRDLLEKLKIIEDTQNSSETKNEKWMKSKDILKYVADKGVDVAIMFLPQIIKALQG